MTNLLEVTISGSFVASDGDIESYDKVTGIIPALDPDKAQQMVIRRYARIWITQATNPKTGEARYKRVQRLREVFIDSIEDSTLLEGKTLSYVGKDIMDMNYEELQDLAAAKDLAAVPLYKTGSLMQARRVAFAEYASKVLGLTEPNERGIEGPIDWRKEGFNPAKYQPIIADGSIRRSGDVPMNIEESIDRELLNANTRKPAGKKDESAMPSRLTIDQLKSIAQTKNIQYHPNIGYDALYKRIYANEAAA